MERDERRTAWLASRGFRVLRFWNTDVLQRTEGVLESIRAALLEPPPFPSPQGGGRLPATSWRCDETLTFLRPGRVLSQVQDWLQAD